MRYAHFWTQRSCRQRQALAGSVRQRVDELVSSLRIEPMIGAYDHRSGLWRANVGGTVRISYRVTQDPPQVIVETIEPSPAEVAARLADAALAHA